MANDLVNPLIIGIGDATKGKLDTPASTDEVIQALCAVLGETETTRGTDPMGRSNLRMQVLQVFNKTLKAKELATSVSKGRWALTDSGLQLYRGLKNMPAPIPETEPVPVPVEPQPILSGVGISWNPKGKENTYSEDPQIVGLAIASTPCFGFWSADSDTCTACPIQGSCWNRVLALLPSIVESLTKPKTPVPAPAIPGKAIAVPDSELDIDALVRMIAAEEITDTATVLQPKSKKVPAPPFKKLKCSAESICPTCGKPVKLGEDEYWVRANPNAIPGVVGVHHVKCFEERFDLTATP